MKLQNSDGTKTFSSHCVDNHLEKKVPGFGVGKNWKKKNGKLNGNATEFIWREVGEGRPGGVYFKLDGKTYYTADRSILELSSVKVAERKKAEPKAKAEKPAKTEKAAKPKKAPKAKAAAAGEATEQTIEPAENAA